MRRACGVLVALIVVVLLSACASLEAVSTPVEAPAENVDVAEEAPATPTPAPPTEPELGAYGYTIEDVGDGWYEGTVRLWLENSGDTVVLPESPPRRCCSIDVQDAYVETEEGKTYPAEVISELEFGHSEGIIDLRAVPAIPPGFRAVSGLTDVERVEARDYAWGQYVVKFKYSQASHPIAIVFPAKPEWRIDLGEAVRGEPTTATDLPASEFEPIQALDGRVLLDDPERLLITLGSPVVVAEEEGQAGYISFTAVNRDQLDQDTVVVPFPARGSVVRNRELWFLDDTTTVSVGPGQEKEGRIKLFTSAPGETTHVILYWPDGTCEVYSTARMARATE
jgi:hypothetical protein